MKRIFLYTSLLSTLFLTASCDKKLGLIEPEYFINTRDDIKTLDDCDKLLNGAYKAMINTGYYGNNMLMTDLMTADAIKGNTTYLDAMQLVDWTYNPTSAITTKTWLAAYNVIAHTNIVIEAVDKVPNKDDQQKRKILGQAYAIRGMVFFDLLRLYAEDYDRNSDRSGIVIRTQVDITSIPRATVKESYDQIFDDLTTADDLLKNTTVNASSANSNYIDEWGTKALLARVSLYAGMFDKAFEYASLVINNPKFKLESGSAFKKVWHDDIYGGEVIFGLRVNLVDNIRIGTFIIDFNSAYNYVARRSYFDPSVTLTKNYDKAKDVRYYSYFSDTIRVGTPTAAKTNRAMLIKYAGRNATWDNVEDVKLIRLAEMYLTRAESALHLPQHGEGSALADLEAVRNARIDGYSSQVLEGEELREAISLERRKEFPFEAQIWFDLRRHHIDIDRDPDIFKSNKASNLTLSADSYLRAWPIPYAEIYNPDGVLVKQNQDY